MSNAIRLSYPYVNETRNTIKADHPIINWFESTGTLQLQGSQAATYKVILNRELLNTSIKSFTLPVFRQCMMG